MELALYQVDAFAQKQFEGNPAAVVPLEKFLSDELMQKIALENNLSETAFFTKQSEDGHYNLRWFTPTSEVDLCGHATLATAHVIFNEIGCNSQSISFHTKSGELIVSKAPDGNLILDFPAYQNKKVDIFEDITQGLQATPAELYESHYYIAYFKTEEEVASLEPDFKTLSVFKQPQGVIATAPANSSKLDFVSRYFVPSEGIDEDPVTGSAHCILTPFWAQRLGKTTLHARQISSRGGNLQCNIKGNRIFLKGQAVLYLKGTIFID